MAGFYHVPFSNVVPGAANATPKDSFMAVVRCIRDRIYSYMKKQPESCEVPKLNEDKKLNKILDDYLRFYKNKNAHNVS